MILMKSIGRRLASRRFFSLTPLFRNPQVINENSSNSFNSNANEETKINSSNDLVDINSKHKQNDILTIKDSCLTRLKRILDNPDDKYLRINVEAGGCSGFLYLFDIETSEKLNPSEDLVVERDQYKVVIDKEVLPYIRGSQIEFEESLIKSSFKIINPIAESKCGCGASFSIDFNKKASTSAKTS